MFFSQTEPDSSIAKPTYISKIMIVAIVIQAVSIVSYIEINRVSSVDEL
jgi:hypothetical protein